LKPAASDRWLSPNLFVVLRLSTLFVRTLRDDPADAEVPSHKLLVRAGYIRRWAPGVYSLLPLGQLLQDNISRIVDEEMQAMGGQKVTFPALLPREYYEVSGRWTEYGDTLFRLKDRRKNDFLLAPTHEELFTLLVKDSYSSYKDLPVILYQTQTKYRDEARPRSGILRGREFLMKDSYSFDATDAGLDHSYQLHRDTYERIFTRLGIDYRIVSAMSGAMGGSKSEEFLAPSSVGEDTFVMCTSCDYAANVEAVQVAPPEPTHASVSHPAMEKLHTPDAPGIAALVSHLNETHAAKLGTTVSAKDLLKNIVFKLDGQPIIVLVPGDREVDAERLANAVAPGKIDLFEEEDFATFPFLVKGYISALDMAKHGVVVYGDPRIAAGTAWATGANEYEHHVINAVVARDFMVDHYIEVATVAEGDPCPRCSNQLHLDRAIEIGHIFQLGRKYADAFKLDVLGQDGKPVRVTMGSYGIGVSRASAVIAEQMHDDKGLVWPVSVAPAKVHVVATGKENQIEVALQLAGELEALGISTLVDDRPGVSPGIKFKDSELLGMPHILVVGKNLGDGQLEIRNRRTGEASVVAVADAVAQLVAAVNN
jgi:prolyl-tRNA synthetase